MNQKIALTRDRHPFPKNQSENINHERGDLRAAT